MEFPNDMMMDIISRLPLDKLGKARVLSKFHNEATHHSFYKELVAQCHPILDGFLTQDFQYHRYVFSFIAPPHLNSPPFDLSLSFLPGRDPRILATGGNGLILVETHHPRYERKRFYFICKPSTKQWKGLPSPKTRYFTKSMALFVLRSNPLHFKILRLSDDQIPSKRPPSFSYIICDLFDSESWCWKNLKDIASNDTTGRPLSFLVPVLASGFAHWIVNTNKSIATFDFYSETWFRILMPELVVADINDDFDRWKIELVQYKGKLGLTRRLYSQRPASTELWVMDNYSQRTWTKMNGSMALEPTTFYGSDISVEWSFNEVIFSSLETGRSSSVKLEKTLLHCYKTPRMVVPFMSDFEPWNFHPPPRTMKPRTMAKIIRKKLRLIQNDVLFLTSFSFFFVCYNHYLCHFLLLLLTSAFNDS